jgi:hypothetical protein
MYVGKKNAVVNAKCPYYQSEAKRSITCEGLYDQTENMIKFATEKEKDRHIDLFCVRYPNGYDTIALAAG